MNIAEWLAATARVRAEAPALLTGFDLDADYGTFARRAASIGATGVSMHVMTAMQLAGQAPEGMQLPNPKLGGIFNMGGAAVANYVSVVEPA